MAKHIFGLGRKSEEFCIVEADSELEARGKIDLHNSYDGELKNYVGLVDDIVEDSEKDVVVFEELR